jgi:hypothetical protein
VTALVFFICLGSLGIFSMSSKTKPCTGWNVPGFSTLSANFKSPLLPFCTFEARVAGAAVPKRRPFLHSLHLTSENPLCIAKAASISQGGLCYSQAPVLFSPHM